jgi:hypothetical protein
MSLSTLNLTDFDNHTFNLIARNFRYKITEKSYPTFDSFAYDFFSKANNFYYFMQHFTTKREFDQLFVKIFSPEFLRPDKESVLNIAHTLQYPARASKSAREKVIVAFSVCINTHQDCPPTLSFPVNHLYLQNLSEREINTLFYFIVNHIHEHSVSSRWVLLQAIAKGAYSISYDRYFPDSQYIDQILELRSKFMAELAKSNEAHLYDLQTAIYFDKDIFKDTIEACQSLEHLITTFIAS